MSVLIDLLDAALPTPIKTVFGDPVSYHPASTASVSVTAVLRGPLPDEDYRPDVMICTIFRGDITFTPAQGDLVEIDGKMHTVFDVKQSALAWRMAIHIV